MERRGDTLHLFRTNARLVGGPGKGFMASLLAILPVSLRRAVFGTADGLPEDAGTPPLQTAPGRPAERPHAALISAHAGRWLRATLPRRVAAAGRSGVAFDDLESADQRALALFLSGMLVRNLSNHRFTNPPISRLGPDSVVRLTRFDSPDRSNRIRVTVQFDGALPPGQGTSLTWDTKFTDFP
jgi:hypothetical protein